MIHLMWVFFIVAFLFLGLWQLAMKDFDKKQEQKTRRRDNIMLRIIMEHK